MNKGATETLAATLRRAGGELASAQAPDLLPGLLAAQQRLARPQPSAAKQRRRLAPALAVCFSVMLACALVLIGAGDPPAPVAHQAAAPTPFVTVVSADRWEQLVADGDARAWLVPTELPRERLAALGLPYDPARAGERVRAEVLMHASGDVLAVRVLQ